MIKINNTGPLALIQDLGRPGYRRLGVSPSGAADRAGLRTANRLVGNPEDDAAIEALLGGLRIGTERPVWLAAAGAATTILINGRAESSHRPLYLRPGETLEIVPPTTGLRVYLAVRGGIEVPAVLGSRSTDLLSGLGPAPLRPGDRLPIGRSPSPFPAVDLVPAPVVRQPLEVELLPGPRTDWFTEAGLRTLVEQVWTIAADVDRTAARLAGTALERRVTNELPSEGIIRGAVQVPASGLPLIFGSNHPVTGGYPVVGVVGVDDTDRVAQLRPGDRLRFRWRAGETVTP